MLQPSTNAEELLSVAFSMRLRREELDALEDEYVARGADPAGFAL